MLKYKKLAEHIPSKRALKKYFKEVDQLIPPSYKNNSMCDKMTDIATEILSLNPDYATTSSHFRGVRDSAVCLFR